MKRSSLYVLITIFGILLTVGITYAYFTANLTGTEEGTTITVTGGTMNIIYNGGDDINISDIIPDNDPAASKTFTVTGNNTTDVEMAYEISLVVNSNDFSEEALKYRLISTNTGASGEVIPTINEPTDIGTGEKTISLGTGFFTSPTSGDKIHTYVLEIYFPDADYNQNIDQNKEINAYIEIKNYLG